MAYQESTLPKSKILVQVVSDCIIVLSVLCDYYSVNRKAIDGIAMHSATYKVYYIGDPLANISTV